MKLEEVEKIFNNKEIETNEENKLIITVIKNYKAFYYNFKDIYNEHKAKLSIQLLKEIHKILMKDLYRQEFKYALDKEGEFKKKDYKVGLFNVGAKAEKVQEELQELIDEVNAVKITEENVYKVVAYVLVLLDTSF